VVIEAGSAELSGRDPDATAARRRATRRPRLRPPLSALLLLGYFVLLTYLAWPAALHHWKALEGDAALAALEAGRPLTVAGFERALSSRAAALAVLEVGSTRRDLGHAHLRRGLQLGGAADGIAADNEAAAAALRAALARAPADHFAWYHLALVEAIEGDPEAASAALATALAFAPYHPPIQRARARLGLALWDELDAATRNSVLIELAGTLRSRR